jgi:ferredoxin-NADP reductase
VWQTSLAFRSGPWQNGEQLFTERELDSMAPTATLVPQAARRRSPIRRALASGLVDRLCAPHGVDRYLELIDPNLVVREVRARVTGVERQTPGTVTLTLAPNDVWTGFAPGQHVVVGVEIDGVVHQRCFSLAGHPDRADGTLELTVKANPNGTVSRHLVEHARAGDTLRLSPAQGDFTLPAPAERTQPLVLISGGSGITPILAMLRTLVADGHTGPVTHVHYDWRLDTVCYLDELRSLAGHLENGRFLLGLTDDPEGGDLSGFYGPDHLAELTDDPASAVIYLCGPAPLMASVLDHHRSLGLVDRVHLERFGPAPITVPAEGAGASGTVTFERSGVAAADGGTLLDIAENAGLRPPTGCRRGICGTCTTTKVTGTVADVISGAESSAEGQPVRLCITRPCGDVALAL